MYLASTFVALSCWATDVPLSDRPEHWDVGKPHHAPALLPSVDYTNGVLTVYSPYAIEDMTVIICDADGNVLYSTVLDVANTAVINLPMSILDSMATLEIIYDDRHLYGEF